MRTAMMACCVLWIVNVGVEAAWGDELGVRYARAGVFHEPRIGAETWRVGIVVPKGISYSKLRVLVDVKVGPWNDRDGKTNHAVLWLNRGEKWRGNLLGYVNVFGEDRPRVKMANNLGQAAGMMKSQQKDWVAEKGKRYQFEYVNDTQAESITLTVREKGKTVATLKDKANVGELVFEEGLMRVIVGHPGTDVGPEVASYGWVYSNLVVELD